MRFYRLHRNEDNGVSCGYTYFTTKREADKAARDWLKENGPEESADVDQIEIKPTKAGILAALNREAGHPDNG